MKERCILHCDANCFYASVETVLNPDLRGKAMAVCGSTEERHGIVLAKSEKAKKAGVKTGIGERVPAQTTIFCDCQKAERQLKLEHTMDTIKGRFGKRAIIPAVILGERKMPPHSDREIIMPGIMHK